MLTDKFDYKIDTIWTEFFWGKFANRMDAAHIKFLSAIMMCRIVLHKNPKLPSYQRYSDLRALNENKDGKLLLHFIDTDSYDYIYNCYDILTEAEDNGIDLSMTEFNLWTHACPNSVLEEIAYDSSYSKKALLFAQLEFLQKVVPFDRDAYVNWMRVIRNFVCYSNITIKATSSREDLLRSPEAFDSMISLINTMAVGCQDIYSFLEHYVVRPASYRSDQMAEEVLKAKKIKANPKLRDVIWRLEELSLFRGRISFVLECASSLHINGLTEEEMLERLYQLFASHFRDDNTFSVDLFNRAMLTIDVAGEYRYYDYWSSRWYAVDADKRKFLVDLTELNYYIYTERANGKAYVKSLVSMLLKQDYQSIIDAFVVPAHMPRWKAKLIKEPRWIQNRFSDFIAIADDNSCCYLLKSQRPVNEEGSTCVK